MGNKISEAILKDLYSTDKNTVIKTVNSLKETGHAGYLHYLIDVLKTNEEQEIQIPILSILTQVKDPDAAEMLVKAIENPQNKLVQEVLTNACWQNGLDYTPYLSSFIKLIINGDYMTAFEAFTVIEHMDGTLSKEVIDEQKNYLLENLKSMPEDRKDLIITMINELDRLAE